MLPLKNIQFTSMMKQKLVSQKEIFSKEIYQISVKIASKKSGHYEGTTLFNQRLGLVCSNAITGEE